MGCPDEDTLRRWLAGELEANEAAALWRHVSGCPTCSGNARVLHTTVKARPGAMGATLPPVEHVDELALGATVGRYVILELVGRGGMGVVYAAYDPQLNRKVALKFLSGAGNAEAKARLLREARAMAAVRHPNVVAVFDFGTWGEQVFVVMEFVEGRSLRQWLHEQKPDWRQVVEVFLQAGEGLEAAHQRGLVHRDFKPDNVLVGSDGRVGVTDFGLARRELPAERSPEAAQEPLDLRLTQTGALVGTPAYMSPEQIQGGDADARSDQFSFCVALYEALYGERPFDDSDWLTLKQAVLHERRRDPPATTEVPRTIRRLLLRGLARDPHARHASMRVLLVSLARDPRRVPKLALASAVSASMVALLFWGGFAVSEWRSKACEGAAARFADVWDGQSRADMERAFLATGRPSARQSFALIAEGFDAFARRWTDQREQACRATHVDRVQSEALLDLRIACLDQALVRVAELSRRLRSADGETVDGAALAVGELPSLKSCLASARLAQKAAVVRTRPEQERATRVRAALARVEAALIAGRPADATSAMDDALTLLKDAPLPELEAEVELLHGWMLVLQKKPAEAEVSLRKAAVAASSVGDDERAAQAWSWLVHVVGARLERYDEAYALAQVARDVIQRLPGSNELALAALERRLAGVYARQGNNQQAVDRYQRALEMYRGERGENDPVVAQILFSQGACLRRMGKYAEAEEAIRRAVEHADRLLGDHPITAAALVNLGPVMRAQGKPAEAREALERAASIYERTTGPDSSVLHNLAVLEWSQGELERALELSLRAFEMEKAQQDVASGAFYARLNIAGLMTELDRNVEALTWYQQTLALALPRFSAEHAIAITALAGVADAERRLGALDDAEAHAGRAVALAKRAVGADAPLTKQARVILGKILVERGRNAAAIVQLDGASPGDEGLDAADAEEWLARALVGARRDRARAKVLAGTALTRYAQGGPAGRKRAAALEAWMKNAGLK